MYTCLFQLCNKRESHNVTLVQYHRYRLCLNALNKFALKMFASHILTAKTRIYR